MMKCDCRMFAVIVTLVAAMSSSAARACVLAAPMPHGLDPAEQRIDRSPPSVAVANLVSIKRGRAGGITSCSDIGRITLSVESVDDDRTSPNQLGYRLELMAGRLPPGLNLPKHPIRAVPGEKPQLVLYWADGAGRKSLDFGLTVTAVDLAGNEGPPSALIRIRDK